MSREGGPTETNPAVIIEHGTQSPSSFFAPAGIPPPPLQSTDCPMDFDPQAIVYPVRLEWTDDETDVYDNMVDFVSNVEFLDGMRDHPEFELFDARGRKLYFVVHGFEIKRVSFEPDTGPPSRHSDYTTTLDCISCFGCGVVFLALAVYWIR